MVIAFQYWRYGIGGGERVTAALIQRFVDAGHTVLLFTDIAPSDTDQPLPQGVTHYVFPQTPEERASFLKKHFKDAQVDICIYGSWISPFATQDCKTIVQSGVKLVYMVHGSSAYFIDKANGNELLQTMQSCAELAHAVVCLSEVDKLFWQAFNSNVFCIPNPVNDYIHPSTTPRAQHGSTVVWVGRLDPVEKCPEYVIQAFTHTLRQVPHAQLYLVGGGSQTYEANLQQLCKQLGIAKSVHFIGETPNAAPYLEKADVYCLTSPTEGFPLALTEAMYAALPVVMFRLHNLLITAHCEEGVVQVDFGDTRSLGEGLARVLCMDDATYSCMSASVLAQAVRVCSVDLHRAWQQVFESVQQSELANKLDKAIKSSDNTSLQIQQMLEGYRRLSDSIKQKDCYISALEQNQTEQGKKLEELQQDYTAVINSVSFKVGRKVTAFPRFIRSKLYKSDTKH
ncbi:glycosyltransferase [Atopobium fossor]|uniref:glycosyltransferase n=1 Tax=Atopobium fossor TaxID=39487 RepID=UPI000424A9D8|nr:glycosyltransferase [Atopobium fossor]